MGSLQVRAGSLAPPSAGRPAQVYQVVKAALTPFCLQSAILGFGVFRVLRGWQAMQGFTMEENVITQTTAVATATMPLAAGDLRLV